MSIRVVWPDRIERDPGVVRLRERWDDVIGDDLIVVCVPSIRVGREVVARALRNARPAWFEMVSERSGAEPKIEDTLARLGEPTRSAHNVRVIDLVAHNDAQQTTATTALTALNFARDQLFRDGLPTIALVRTGAVPWFSSAAPDLWSFCASTCEVETTPTFRAPFILPLPIGAERWLRVNGRSVDLAELAARTREFELAPRRSRGALAQSIMVKFVQHLVRNDRRHEARPTLEVLFEAARRELESETPSWLLIDYGIQAARELDALASPSVRARSEGSAVTFARQCIAHGAPTNIEHAHAGHLHELAVEALQFDQWLLSNTLLDEAAALVEPTSFPSTADIAKDRALVALLRGEPTVANDAARSIPLIDSLPAARPGEASYGLRVSLEPQLVAMQAELWAGAVGDALQRFAPFEEFILLSEHTARPESDEQYVRANLLLLEQLIRWTLGDPIASVDELMRRAGISTTERNEAFHAACAALEALSTEDRGLPSRDAWSRAFEALSSRAWGRSAVCVRWFFRECAGELGVEPPAAAPDGDDQLTTGRLAILKRSTS